MMAWMQKGMMAMMSKGMDKGMDKGMGKGMGKGRETQRASLLAGWDFNMERWGCLTMEEWGLNGGQRKLSILPI